MTIEVLEVARQEFDEAFIYFEQRKPGLELLNVGCELARAPCFLNASAGRRTAMKPALSFQFVPHQ